MENERKETEKRFFLYCYNGRIKFFDTKKEIMRETGLGYKQISKCLDRKEPFWYAKESNMATLHCRQTEIKTLVSDDLEREKREERRRDGLRPAMAILAFDACGTYFHFSSIREASKTLGVSASKIYRAISSGNFESGYCFDFELDETDIGGSR